MSSELTALSLERTAQLVPPQARGELLSVLREAAALLPVAEAVVAACDVPGIRATEPAKSAGLVASAFVVATGMLGSMLGGTVLTWVRVKDPVARGLALGTGCAAPTAAPRRGPSFPLACRGGPSAHACRRRSPP